MWADHYFLIIGPLMEVIKEESFEIDVEELATKKEEDQKDEAARALHLKPDYVRKCKMPLQDKE